jgi:DNA-binding XRE family transcriptional regulator
MRSKVPCYLRTLRREWGLTQKELATLVPGVKRVRVSKVERGKRVPKSTELLAYALIFDRRPEAIFPTLSQDIEAAVRRNASCFSSIGEKKGERRKHQLIARLRSQKINNVTN